jgi:hypothetical protein
LARLTRCAIVASGSRRDLRAVERHDADLHQPRARTHLEHAAEEVGDRPLVTRPEPSDGSGTWFAQITRKATSDLD